MTYEHIRVDTKGAGIATVTVARPDIFNASSPEMFVEIKDAFLSLSADQNIRAIILAAEGKHFSVGADFAFIERLGTMSANEIKDTVYSVFQGAARAIYRCPKPTLALIQGAAVTVGCEVALACDFRMAADDVMFQETWIKLGIMPPLGGTFLLPRIIGLGRAMEMCLRAKQVRSEEALRIGLVGEVVDRADLETRGQEMARELATLAPLAYATIKQSIQRALESSMDVEWQANLSNQALLFSSSDHREGLAAVREKRSPTFLGA